ncbi:PEP-CTERM sorting domain-containing protein [Chlorobaculum sp. 24CR]|nr:PEP-CTERM sorting domain-containing protein [Chlorobaculum sp. 24CR]
MSGGTVADDFTITSAFPNGIVTWSTTGGSGTTAGPVPEPATVMLLGIGGLLAGGRKLYESRKEAATA